ncbi:hypothetical protein HY496_02735, partial [Candidatus Woesearchaeota archaeon]|nr:hypothetical protein [Candidatus Woesearchaeota archaeon]
NSTLMGIGSFSFDILTETKDAIVGNEISLRAKLELTIGDHQMRYTQFGGTKISIASKDLIDPMDPKKERIAVKRGEPIDLGADMKTAAADVFKKLASCFGVGAYLYDKEYHRQKAIQSNGQTHGQSHQTTSNGHGPAVSTGPVVVNTPAPSSHLPIPNPSPSSLTPARKIQEMQKTALKVMFETKGVSEVAFLTAAGKKTLDELTHEEAGLAIRELSAKPLKKVGV